MKAPRRAIVLAAGRGSRLAPITFDLPKPLIPLRGEAVIGRCLRQLHGWGVREVLVNLHHLAAEMLEGLPPLCPPGLQLQFSYEPELLGTGGALRRMEWFFGPEPLWVCNADVWFSVDPNPLLRRFARRRPLACLWMVPDAGPRTVRLKNGRVVDFHSGGHTFSGLHLLSREILQFLPTEEQFASVIPAYEKAIAAGLAVEGVEVPGGEWADIGSPAQLLAAAGESVVCPGARVAAGARLRNAVVGPGARLRRGCAATGLIVSPARGLDAAERRRLPDVEAVELFDFRGSDRVYRRLHRAGGTEILVRCGDARPENLRMPGHTRFLRRHRIPVPRVLAVRESGHWARLEDVGDEDLLTRHQTGRPDRVRTDLLEALRLTADLHRLPLAEAPPMELPFSPRLYTWERELFRREFLGRFHPDFPAEAWLRALERTARVLGRQPAVLLHRDLQSTNLLWHRGGPVLIDFQGMRPGPAAYDLASLLADPYCDRPPEAQREGLAFYNQHAAREVSESVYAHAVTQRLTQALGAYGRLGALPGTRRFLRHVPAALRQLAIWAPSPEVREGAQAILTATAHDESARGSA